MKKWVWLLLCFVTFGVLAVYWVERSKDAESKRISESSLREAVGTRKTVPPESGSADSGSGYARPPTPRTGGDTAAGSPSLASPPPAPYPGGVGGGGTEGYEPPPPPTNFDSIPPPPSQVYPDSGVADSDLYPNPGFVPPDGTDPGFDEPPSFELESPADPLEGVDPQYLPTEPLEGEAIPPEEFE